MNSDLTHNDVVVRLDHITKKFGNFTAVSNVTFDIHRGEILGFLGPNGAGKSTTMKMLGKLLNPNEGDIYIRGNGHLEKLTNKNKDYLLNNIGFLIENPAFYGNMTPREILTYFAELKGYPKKKVHARVEEVVAMIKLTEWIDKKMKTFSKGMRQKIGIISAIVHDPEIIVFDEPHSGLDPTARKLVRNFILSLKDMGKTIFLSSHLLYEVSEVADRVAMISHGEIVALDTLDNLERRAQGSIIEMELYNCDSTKCNDFMDEITRIVGPLTGLPKEETQITFNSDNNQFEILFNGDSQNQVQIFKALFESGFEVLEFSVPKADLLEDLYMKFMDTSDEMVAIEPNGDKPISNGAKV